MSFTINEPIANTLERRSSGEEPYGANRRKLVAGMGLIERVKPLRLVQLSSMLGNE